MQVNLFFDYLSNGELLTLKTGPPCILDIQIFSNTKNSNSIQKCFCNNCSKCCVLTNWR